MKDDLFIVRFFKKSIYCCVGNVKVIIEWCVIGKQIGHGADMIKNILLRCGVQITLKP